MTKSPFRIFHIDDNPLDRELIRDALEEESNRFALTVATSRQEFETYLAKNTFDLVLTDFNILGFEGLQVIDAVRKKDPILPVIVVTGTGSEEIAVEAMKRGADDYVIKTPRHIRRLPLTIQSAIERKNLKDQNIIAEHALRSSEERLRAFASALPDLAFVIDEDGRFIHLLNAPQSLLYRPAEDLQGKLICDVLPQAVAKQIMSAISRTIQTGSTQSVEYQLKLPSGLTWFEGRTSRMLGEEDGKQLIVYVARDITHRKEMELKLRRERNLLRTLIDNVPDYIFVQDQNGYFTASNAAHAALANIAPQEIIGRDARDVFTTTLIDQLHNDDGQVLQSGEALVNEERFLVDSQGKPQWVLMTKVPIRNDDAEIIGLVGIARDITEHLRAERLQLELEKEQELIALKERFISIASHDFRTPLTIIKMSANMLDRFFDQITPEQRIAKLHQISNQVDNMIQLIDDVLTMSKANAGKLNFNPEQVELRGFCEEIWGNFQQLAEKTHRMDFTYQSDQLTVFIDPNLIHYVIVNVLSNAVKYSPVNGHVRFEVLCHEDQLMFRISDNGIGIPDVDRSQLFQPFHRATNTQGIEGTGLGLSIVRNYVDVHQGHIEVESTENQGTTFTIYLPCS